MNIPGLYPLFNELWKNYQTVWVYSDPHFGEAEYRDITDDEQIANINSKIGKNDVFLCLGDVGDVRQVARIRGHKVLLMGNHDTGRSNYERVITYKELDQDLATDLNATRARLQEEYPGCRITIGNTLLTPRLFRATVTIDNGLFDEVYEGPLFLGEKLLVSHEPIYIPGVYNIHGHVHAVEDRPGWDADHKLNVCAESINYTPVNLNGLMKKGLTSKIKSIHRRTVNEATKRKKRGGGYDF